MVLGVGIAVGMPSWISVPSSLNPDTLRFLMTPCAVESSASADLFRLFPDSGDDSGVTCWRSGRRRLIRSGVGVVDCDVELEEAGLATLRRRPSEVTGLTALVYSGSWVSGQILWMLLIADSVKVIFRTVQDTMNGFASPIRSIAYFWRVSSACFAFWIASSCCCLRSFGNVCDRVGRSSWARIC